MIRVILSSLVFLIFCSDMLCSTMIMPLYPKIALSFDVSRVELKKTMSFITVGYFTSMMLLCLASSYIKTRAAFILLFSSLFAGSLISLLSENIYYSGLVSFYRALELELLIH